MAAKADKVVRGVIVLSGGTFVQEYDPTTGKYTSRRVPKGYKLPRS